MSTLRVPARVRLALLLSALLSLGAWAQTAVKTPRTIRVVLDDSYTPYSFRSDEGKLQGVLIDQWQAWEKKTGIKVEIHAMDWAEALRRMGAGEFDVIDTIVETAERREAFDFTPRYAMIQVPIFFRSNISGITDLASLRGFPVGVKEGDQHVEKLRASGVTTLVPFRNFAAMIEAAKEHKVNVFVADAPSALYYLNKSGIEAEFRHSTPVFRDGLQRAVRKGDAAMLRKVEEGFAAIEPGVFKEIDEKWFGSTVNWYGRYFINAAYGAETAILLIAGLAAWNRALRKRVLQRTAALGESEERFRRLVELMPIAVYVCDTSGLIQIYNKRAAELWGRAPKLGDTAQCYCGSLRLYSTDGKIVPHEESKMAEVLRTGVEARDLEIVIERPDGSCITVLVNIAPLRDGRGELIGAINCFQDITEQKSAAEAVKQAEHHLRLDLDTIPTMVWTILPDGSLDFLNQRWREYTGLSLEEAIKDPTGTVHPEDLPLVLEKWVKDMASCEPFENEMRLRRADGEYRWFLVRTVPMFDEQGNILKWYGTSTDIEDRKRAERESQALIDAIPQQIWSSPADGATDYCNDRWRSYTGLGLEDVRGYGWQTMVHPGDRDRVLKAWHESVANGTPYEQEERHRAADGTYRWFLSLGVPLRDPQGRILRWYGTNTDIEGRKRAEEQLERHARLLELLSRRLFEVQEEERRHLARELHDEIGQTLTAAKLNLKMIAPEVPPPAAGRLEDSIQILDRLLMQVRQISLNLRPPLLDELGLVPALRWLVDQQAQRARLRITFTANVESLEMDASIRTACFRVAQEAITNVIRHAGAATVTVELRAEADRVWLVVQDDGAGFDAGATQQRAAHGSSVGLLSMNERVSLLGGELAISSALGRGTEIRAWFPLVPAEPGIIPEIG
jgi:PAS domain S-box-containing protein